MGNRWKKKEQPVKESMNTQPISRVSCPANRNINECGALNSLPLTQITHRERSDEAMAVAVDG